MLGEACGERFVKRCGPGFPAVDQAAYFRRGAVAQLFAVSGVIALNASITSDRPVDESPAYWQRKSGCGVSGMVQVEVSNG
ncbi:MAG: hypothetical protein KDI74_13920 [Gammaproteobacteria bacterium]|nr:hypothetical protein [Gammaproteobacteria bacterium]HXK56143.1 hypothetical protein [Gammaproteobacteria bacterium]